MPNGHGTSNESYVGPYSKFDVQIGPVPPKAEDYPHSLPVAPEGCVVLDPADPFDAALIPIVETNRRKRRDYASDGDVFSNFRTSATLLGIDGFGPTEAALFNVTQKLARLQSLRLNGRMDNAANEAVMDTYLDLACYSILVFALAKLEDQS